MSRSVVTGHVAGCGSLYSLQSIYVALKVWAPEGTPIFNFRVDKSQVCYFPAGLWAVMQVSSKKAESRVCFFTNVVNMGFPLKVVRYCNTKISIVLNLFKNLIIDCVEVAC